MDKNTLFFLIDKYLAGSATTEESALLEEYYDRLEKTGTNNLSIQEKTMLKEEMYRNILHDISNTSKVIPLYKRTIFRRIAVAASILLLLSTGAYFLIFNKQQKQIAKAELNHDVKAPLTNKAMITLANGQNVYLDSANNGMLAQQGNIKLVKLSNGQIAYQGDPSTGSGEMQYNTLSNPRGSKVISMTLADGSKVWLNTGSTLTYPVAFVGNERKVSITGEAYFEITHDATKPFTVTKGETSVKVLGTHFNVNTYDDEAELKITLLEGSVQVALRQAQGDKTQILKPGQQALIANTPSGGRIKVQAVDVDEVIGWQRGIFTLNNTELPAIMREISRWYDLNIVYEGNPGNEKFGGVISKNHPLSSVLKLLEENGVKFTLEGKTLKVLP